MKLRMSAAEAGRRGGASRSAKKLAACRRNGFQKGDTTPITAPEIAPAPPQKWQGCIDGKQTSEYMAFANARTRCTNPNSDNWSHYGGRGIKFLFESFEQFMDELGPKPAPHFQLDRFPNNDGNYEPGNVRWATPTENSNNRRCSLQPPPLLLLAQQEGK